MKKLESLTSADIVAQNIETLKQLFPTIVKEGQIDVEELKALLTDEAVVSGNEYYRFTWAGKAEARAEANKASTATLRPDKESSKDWDTTGNIFIEGDNLEVLKLLQKSYSNKIKMIYIDPPYNTGKDFVYRDNYKDNLANYLEQTGQLDEEGRKTSTNSDSDGRYHSNWLNMMYPRLRLARNLMSEDGVIFISIDDNEQANLKKLCDEVFGEENFVAQLAVQLNPRGRHLDRYIAKTHEAILIYTKNISSSTSMSGIEKEGDMEKEYNLEDERGKYRLIGLRNRNQSFNPITRPKLFYPIYINPITLEVAATQTSYYTEIAEPITADGISTCWTWGKEKVEEENTLLTAKLVNDIWQVFRKDYLYDESGNKSLTLIKSLWIDKDINNDNGKKSIKSLFDTNIMDFPKSPDLIDKMLKSGSNSDSIILDFFAGSGTTAHAVMQLNAEDGGIRKCISVQLPEPTDDKSEAYKAGYSVISDITKERIRRAGEKIKADNKDKEGIEKLDVGFKAFKLDSSNVRAWDSSKEALQQQLDLFVENNGENIKADRTEEDILFEVLLKYGLDLSIKIEKREVANTPVYNIGYGSLFICLANKITTAVAEGIGAWKEELQPATCRVIFKDTGFGSDADKTNSMQILKRFHITEVATI